MYATTKHVHPMLKDNPSKARRKLCIAKEGDVIAVYKENQIGNKFYELFWQKIDGTAFLYTIRDKNNKRIANVHSYCIDIYDQYGNITTAYSVIL